MITSLLIALFGIGTMIYYWDKGTELGVPCGILIFGIGIILHGVLWADESPHSNYRKSLTEYD